MRHGSVVCTVTVYIPSGISPLQTFRFPLLSCSMRKKKLWDTGYYYTED